MNSNDSILELVSSYETYMDAGELDVTAATDAPATTWYCAGAAISFISAVTYEATC